MSTVAVTCKAIDQNGQPIAGAVYVAILQGTAQDGGFIAPNPVIVTADASGTAVLNLWPNEAGLIDSSYRIAAWNPVTRKRFIDQLVRLPNRDVNLDEVIIVDPGAAVQPPDEREAQSAAAAAAAAAAAVSAQLLDAGLATAENQLIQIDQLTGISGEAEQADNYKLVQSEDLGAGTKYILKSDGVGWLMIRKTYTDSSSLLEYAGPGNNPNATDAWTQRADLAYGSIGGV